MDGDERRGARRVEAHRRSLETKGVGDTAGDDARSAAGDSQVVDCGRVHLQPVPRKGRSGEHSCLAAPQRFGVDPRILAGLPRAFEQQSLLWVHLQSLVRADPKKGRVEAGDVFEKPTMLHVGLAWPIRVWIEDALQIPVAIRGKRTDRVASVSHQVPQFLG